MTSNDVSPSQPLPLSECAWRFRTRDVEYGHSRPETSVKSVLARSTKLAVNLSDSE